MSIARQGRCLHGPRRAAPVRSVAITQVIPAEG
jgi:hypothetical protein